MTSPCTWFTGFNVSFKKHATKEQKPHHSKKPVLQMWGNYQYELFTAVHAYCISLHPNHNHPQMTHRRCCKFPMRDPFSISAATTYAWTHSWVQQTVCAIKAIAWNLIKATLIIMVQAVEMRCGYWVMSTTYSQLSDWTCSRTIIIMSIPDTNKPWLYCGWPFCQLLATVRVFVSLLRICTYFWILCLLCNLFFFLLSSLWSISHWMLPS